ncbi:MAG: HAD-IIIA family hydrolase [Melioribacteraceae bacterium]|nr:HAD-IIIA family hydrolase [Melioribacteraceae bacterium]
MITHSDVDKVNLKINDLLREQNTSIDVFYYCPFHPEISGDEKAKCRKPSPAMIFKAADDYDIDLSNSYLIGDRATDIFCGLNAKVKSILLYTDELSDEINSLKNEGKSPNFVADDFLDAVEFIKKDIN